MIEPSPTIIENLLSAKYKDIVVVNALEQGLSLLQKWKHFLNLSPNLHQHAYDDKSLNAFKNM